MRRVVTGPAEGGKAGIVLDGEPPTVVEFGQYRTTELWVADGPEPTAADTATRPWELEPPPGGSCFRIVELAPETAGAGQEVPEQDDPGFLAEHTTDTIDYLIVISGEVTLTIGGAEVTLGPGDTVVQQGTPHDWRNRGTEPCVMAGVLISTK
ncbi:MAG TPA: cupin domain-containing protein [Streptosporangiaceae bacterium]|nr:cupin domain-containing protein [Streptosporangiaceae bacterium]